MANKNLMMVNGKDINPTDVYRAINLADDDAEVRGFGQPISRARAKQMAEAYFTLSEAAWSIVQEIDTNRAYIDLKNNPAFAQMKNLLDPATQTVSGVFGKEAILQILSMRHCEGIRYIVGNDGDKNTIVLVGVREAGVATGINGIQRATSAPVNLQSALRSSLDGDDIPIDIEVHKDSLTIGGIRQAIFANPSAVAFTQALAEEGAHGGQVNASTNVSDVLFGEY